jgi:hypothetical protein
MRRREGYQQNEAHVRRGWQRWQDVSPQRVSGEAQPQSRERARRHLRFFFFFFFFVFFFLTHLSFCLTFCLSSANEPRSGKNRM